MKKIAFLFIFIFTALCLASCASGSGGDVSEECEHEFGEWELFGDLVDGSCEGSEFAATCALCNEVSFKRGDASNHVFETVTVEPTCTTSGYDEKTCKTCGKVEKVNETGILPHDFKRVYSADASYHWFGCSGCDEIKDKAEHKVGESGACSVCGTQILPTEGIIYGISADGTYAEVIGYTGTATKILIASEYQGLPVKTIYDEAFENKAITSVIIPDSVTSIGGSAFAYCSKLQSVTISDSVTSIGSSAFEDCYALESVTIGNGVTSIGDRAFAYCSALWSVTIGNGVTSIGSKAFAHCDALGSVTIPDSVTSIGSSAFQGCSALGSVTIGNGVISIGDRAFFDCYALGSITIPDSVTSIGSYAFEGCSSLRSVTIPDSVTSIGDRAFSYCSALDSVTIGGSVTSIGSRAFYNCDALKSVIFEDTSTWYIISISSDNAKENWQNKTGGTETDVSDPEDAAYYLRSSYDNYYWYKL